jgi:hypothetical protein
MLWWLVILGLNVALVLTAFRIFRQASPRKALGRLALVCAINLFVWPLVGIALGLRLAFSATGGASVDPAQKARILAEGLAEAMNCTAFGVLVFFVPTVTALLLFVRSIKSPPPSDNRRA